MIISKLTITKEKEGDPKHTCAQINSQRLFNSQEDKFHEDRIMKKNKSTLDLQFLLYR